MEKVMVVDDDEGIRCLYEQVLTDEGYKVILASDGLEAVEIFKNIKPDIIVLDIRMPGMDGIELLGKVLDMDRKLPVIINSAYSMYKNNFLTWMADAYVIKSSDLTELKLKIRELLEAKKKKNTESN
ncbi:response regulator [candidate division WOR-3 bacterium]|nr:response regulator [candidate division WOR-3 bacterium]